MQRRILNMGIILFLVSLLCFLECEAVKAETYDDYSYYVINDGTEIMIYDYLGKDREIIIPSTIDDKPVTTIARNTFDGEYSYFINTVCIPESVTRIEECAFVNCANLTNITIPESVTYIGPYAFQNCSKLTDILIPSSVTSIYSNTFQGCTELESITIPNSITSIANSAFKDCISLKSIILPDSIIDIGDSVFENCTELANITMSKGIASIGWNAFSETKWLEDRRAESPLVIVDNYLIDGKGCSGNVIIPNNVTVMAGGAFNECTDSINIVISDSMTTIPWRAFLGCTYLTGITVPNGVTQIEWGAFSGCTSLASVTLPDSVTRIEEYAFSDCTSLKSVVIPKNLTSIELSVFEGCANLEDITIPETVTSIDGSAFYGTKWLNNEQNEHELVIVNNILVNGQICSGAVVIPSNVTKLGDSAFEDCTKLTNITIPNSVTSIRNSVFKGCTGLTSVTVPNSVTGMGGHVFAGCTGLTSVTIPESVTEIGVAIFSGCENLAVIYADEGSYAAQLYAEDLEYSVKPISDNAQADVAFSGKCGDSATWELDEQGNLTINGSGRMYDYDALLSYENAAPWNNDPNKADMVKSISIADGITYIGDYAFYHCDLVTEIQIPETVEEIGTYAFGACMSLKELNIPSNVKVIGAYAFYWCNTLESVVMAEGVTTIQEGAFDACSHLENISIPSTVNTIEWAAFGKDLGETIWWKKQTEENNFVIINNILVYGSDEENVVVPDGVISIQGNAFYHHTYVKNITVPDTVTYIGEQTFCRCPALERISLSENITYIGNSAFQACDSLKEINIPAKVISIGEQAFNQCGSLTNISVDSENKVYDSRENCNAIIKTASNTLIYGCKESIIPSSVTAIEDYAFYGFGGLENIEIPKSVTKIGNNAFGSCTSLIINCTKDSYAYQYAKEHEIDVNIICQHTNTEPRNTKNPTCKEEGYSGDTYCEDCNTLLSLGTVIAKVEHTWDAGVITTQAIVSAEGVKTYTCTACGETRTETIAKLEDNTHEEVIQNGSKVIVSKLTYTVTDVKKSIVTCTGNSDKKATTITIPGTVIIQGKKYKVTKIADNAFKNNKKIKKVTIGNNVTSVEKNAFRGCTNLKTLTMGKKVKSIGNSAFEGCKKLTKVTLTTNVTSIGSKAFYKCEKLKTVTIETAKLKTIGKKAFAKIANNAMLKFKKSIPAGKREKYLKLLK